MTIETPQPKTEYTFKNETDTFITKYGSSLSEKRPRVVYLRTKAKITPTEEKKNYIEDVLHVKDKFTEYVQKTIFKSKDVANEYLFNIDIAEKNVAYGKTSFLRYDLFLKPQQPKSLEKNRKLFEKYAIRFNNRLKKILNDNNIMA